MLTLINEPQEKYDILVQGFLLYRRCFWTSLIYSIPAALLIFSPLFIIDFYQLFDAQGLHFLIFAIFFAAIFGSVLFLNGLIFRLYCFCYKIPTSFLGSLKHALSKLIPVIMVGALYTLIVLGGTMVLIIPGIIFTVSLMFSFILAITSNQNLLQTLTNSHRLVWGHWWHVFFVISIPLLLNMVVFLMVFLTIIWLSFLFAMPISEINPWVYLINMTLQIFFIPYTFCIALVLLHDLRQRSMAYPHWIR